MMTDAANDGWHAIGSHSVRFEEPDILHIRIVGDLGNDQVRGLLNTFEESIRNVPRPVAMVDISKSGRPNLDILKSSDLLDQMRRYRAFVYYNAQFSHRTVLDIVRKISRAFRLSLQYTPLIAFATEAEAYAWIEQFRKQ